MYSLIWQSVMWRPGKGRVLIGVKNPLPIRPAAIASQRTPPGPRRSPGSQRQSGYALLPSRTWRHFLIQIDAPFSPCLPRRKCRGNRMQPYLLPTVEFFDRAAVPPQ
ncbi:MAG: hypothetical protein ACJ8D9_10930, partial [Xanthobacteraceae bacterium]